MTSLEAIKKNQISVFVSLRYLLIYLRFGGTLFDGSDKLLQQRKEGLRSGGFDVRVIISKEEHKLVEIIFCPEVFVMQCIKRATSCINKKKNK